MMSIENRSLTAIVGYLAGLGLWAVTDTFGSETGDSFPALAVVMFAWIAGGAFVALIGPLSLWRAALGAVVIGGCLTALQVIAALRHPSPSTYLDLVYGPGLAVVLTILALPFVLGWLRGDGVPAPYATLFDETLTGIIRVCLAVAFTGAIWLLVFLSSELLKIAGVYVLDRLIEHDWFGFSLTGGLIGLSVAVVSELLETRPPAIVLRILRLLVPFVLAVVLVFLVALPINGFGRTFGVFSAAGTLMAVASVALFLVTLVIGTGTEEPPHPVIRRCAQVLSALLPVLAAGALIAVYMRVRQYGWTPERLVAVTYAGVLFAFGLMSALALIRRAGWDDAFRRGNRVMLLVSIVVGAAWLLPVIRPEAISATSQADRVPLDATERGMFFWDMAHAWGHAGQSRLAMIRATYLEAGDAKTVALIDQAVAAEMRYSMYDSPDLSTAIEMFDALEETLPTWPQGITVSREFRQLQTDEQNDFLKSCAMQLPSGSPACVAIRTDLDPETPGQETVFFYGQDGYVRAALAGPPGAFQQLTNTLPRPQSYYSELLLLDGLQRGVGLDAQLIRPAIKIGEVFYYLR